MAISESGKLFSWGIGFKGKLGLGYSASAKACMHQHFPKQIKRGLQEPENEEDKTVTHAGCGRSISLVLTMTNDCQMWGKLDLLHIRFNDYKKFSKPYLVEEKIKIRAVAVGQDHYMMVDKQDLVWVCGDNSRGTLGVSDGKHRIIPARNMFFDKMRIIDFTCGDGFTVVIAETFTMTKEEDKLYFKAA